MKDSRKDPPDANGGEDSSATRRTTIPSSISTSTTSSTSASNIRPNGTDHHHNNNQQQQQLPHLSTTTTIHRYNRRSYHRSNSASPTIARRLSANQEEVLSCLPIPFRQFVLPYHGDFCFSRVFNPSIIVQLMAEGFLPIATTGYLLLPKMHSQRCVIELRKPLFEGPTGTANSGTTNDNNVPVTTSDLHVSKSVRKKAKKFTITASTSFDAVIGGCQEQHGDRCWLYPPLVEAFRRMFLAGTMYATAIDEQTKQPDRNRPPWPVRLYTIEIWNTEAGALAGGELGYTVGSIYTSLTGFSREDSAGSVQLAALGRWLIERDFVLWDLGMDMDYKMSLGAKLMPRREFLEIVHRVRESQGHLELPVRAKPDNCKDIIDRTQPTAPPREPSSSQQQQTTKMMATNTKLPPQQKKEKQQAESAHGENEQQASTELDVQQKLERTRLSQEDALKTTKPNDNTKHQGSNALPKEHQSAVHPHDEAHLEEVSPTKKRVRKLSPR